MGIPYVIVYVIDHPRFLRDRVGVSHGAFPTFRYKRQGFIIYDSFLITHSFIL